MAPYSIKIDYLNYAQQFEYLYENLHRAHSQGAIDELEIDLSNCTFIAIPGHLALITAGRLWHRFAGRPLRLTNMDSNVHAYLDRMDILNQCKKYLTTNQQLHPYQRLSRSPNTKKLLEVTEIASIIRKNETDVNNVVGRARAILETWYSNTTYVNQVLDMLTAVAENITHSQDSGYAMIQRYNDPFDGAASRVSIAITDAGIGIKGSLSPRMPPDTAKNLSGSDYIVHALEAGVTSRIGAGGLGLAQVLRRVHTWQGHLSIRSESSRLDINSIGSVPYDNLVYVPGTQVIIEVHGT